ncbi:MAG: universal stress protein [Gammaproteobacteria bacterium]|nr:universal stress protein [Gammaproteobacteria bacterium]
MSTTDSPGTILVAIDSSRNSMLAAGVGARMARLLNAHLGLIHVLGLPEQSFWGGVEARMKDEIRGEAERHLTAITEKMHSVCDILPEFFIVEGLPEVEIPKVVAEDSSIIMVIAGRYGVASEKHSHLRLGRARGHVTVKLMETLRVPLMVVAPDVPLSHICPAMAEMQAASESNT